VKHKVREKDTTEDLHIPNQYKVDTMSITKFEKNAKGTKLQYDFINAFPKGMTSIPLSYGPAEILKVTVTFNYDRYVVDRSLTNKEIFSRTSEYNPDPELTRENLFWRIRFGC
jgi:hypothetical protein